MHHLEVLYLSEEMKIYDPTAKLDIFDLVSLSATSSLALIEVLIFPLLKFSLSYSIHFIFVVPSDSFYIIFIIVNMCTYQSIFTLFSILEPLFNKEKIFLPHYFAISFVHILEISLSSYTAVTSLYKSLLYN